MIWLDQPKYWEENFDDVSVEGLKSRGWKILDYDSMAFSKQLKPGYLTLYTYPGDYWVKWEKGEKPLIKNMLIKRLDVNSCEITARLKNFDPYQNAQQAGIFLFGPEMDRNNCFRITFVFTKIHEKGIPYRDEWTDRIQSLQARIMINGKSVDGGIFTLRCPEFEPNLLKPITLVVTVDGRNVTTRFSLGDEWEQVNRETLASELHFFPKYIGLAAFQGFTDDNGNPKGADTIPAFFDYVKVEPLPE